MRRETHFQMREPHNISAAQEEGDREVGIKEGPITSQDSGNRRYLRVLCQSQPSRDPSHDAHDGPSKEKGAEAPWAHPSVG